MATSLSSLGTQSKQINKQTLDSRFSSLDKSRVQSDQSGDDYATLCLPLPGLEKLPVVSTFFFCLRDQSTTIEPLEMRRLMDAAPCYCIRVLSWRC